mmetsp:Transcript_44839/g.141200  ORF Transcript_44839/g.141200 Transcript_44839/m.141200 type:complete len:94 (+) Transcript_44839:549-830(+)
MISASRKTMCEQASKKPHVSLDLGFLHEHLGCPSEQTQGLARATREKIREDGEETNFIGCGQCSGLQQQLHTPQCFVLLLDKRSKFCHLTRFC